jgi:amidase
MSGQVTSATVADNALMLEVMAGPDGLDARQQAPKTARDTQALGEGVKGLRVALVREGFGYPNAEAESDAAVRAAAEMLARAGAIVTEISIPLHAAGGAIWTPIFLEGATDLMVKDASYGNNQRGLFLASLRNAHAGWRERADAPKLGMLVAQWGTTRHGGRYYGKAQNLARALRAAYDAALAETDVLLTPTTPMAATPLPPRGSAREDIVARLRDGRQHRAYQRHRPSFAVRPLRRDVGRTPRWGHADGALVGRGHALPCCGGR